MINKKLCHLLILIFLVAICIWDRIVNIPYFPKNFLYLTQLNLYLEIYYFASTLYYELHNVDSELYNHKFFNFSFSLSFLVCSMFWIMFIVNRDTLYKKDVSIPFILNFSLHFIIPLFNFLEQLIINVRKGVEYLSIIVYVLVFIIYSSFLLIIYNIWNIKVYPYIYKGIVTLILVKLGGIFFLLLGHFIYYAMTKTNNKENEENNTNNINRELDNQIQYKTFE